MDTYTQIAVLIAIGSVFGIAGWLACIAIRASLNIVFSRLDSHKEVNNQ